MRRVIFAAVILVGSAPSAMAQVCGGSLSYTTAPWQASAGAMFTKGAQGFGGGLSGGNESLFAGGAVTYQNLSDLESHATAISGNVGGQLAFDSGTKVHFRPVGAVSFQTGPNEPGLLDTKGVGFGAGAQVGVVASNSGNLMIVPTFGASIQYQRFTVEFFDSIEESASDTYGMLNLGVGFILNEKVAFTPLVGVPVGLDGADPQFSFSVTFGFGK